MKEYIFQARLNESLEKFSNRIAIEYGQRMITYSQLDRRSNCIAHWIIDKGIKKETFIGIFIEDRMEFIAVVTGILKAGCVFVPLDPAHPLDRLETMIETADVEYIISDQTDFRQLLSSQRIKERMNQRELTFLLLEELLFANERASCSMNKPGISYRPDDKIYIYFTSGTTGNPKAILGKNKGLAHFIEWEIETFAIDHTFRISQFITVGFDAFLRDVFVPLLSGGTLCIPEDKDIILDPDKLIRWIDTYRIHLMHGVPSFFRLLCTNSLNGGHFNALKFVLLSGEKINPPDLVKWYDLFDERVQLVNFYGPTETTMIKTYYLIRKSDANRESMPLGKPIKGTRVIILDKNMQICKKIEVGEIYIRTPFRTYGYYKEPGLNRKKFIPNPFSNDPNDIIFKTGDLGRISHDGNLEFLGRIDRQVKLRGIRIELEEIENVLLKHPSIKEAVVVKKEMRNNENLFAYITINKESSPGTGDESLTHDLKDYLAKKLPDYMVPAHMMQLEEIPRKPNGKVDYDTLPDPLKDEKTSLVLPGNETERKLLELWTEILGFETISVESSFFELGGNSLNVMTLISKIHREFDVRLPLAEIFKNPSIKKLAVLIPGVEKEVHTFIDWAEEKVYYALSSAQKRMYIVQQIDPDSIIYNMMRDIHELPEKPDKVRFEKALQALIKRHESLRTSFMLIKGEPVQKIHPTVDFKVEYYEAMEEEVGEIAGNFMRPFDLSQAPLLRVGLLSVKETRHILMIDKHHIISDALSDDILFRDFMTLYEGRELPQLNLQYRDFSEWQNWLLNSGSLKKQEEYWLKEFTGEIPVLELAYDFPRPKIQRFEGRLVQFAVDSRETRIIKAFTLVEEVTLYMLLLTIYNIFLFKLSGQQDIIVGTPIAGRRHEDLEPVVGMFVNTLAIRNHPWDHLNFRELLQQVKTKTLEAFENQEYQFEDLVNRVTGNRDASRSPLFDVMFALDDVPVQDENIPGEDSSAEDLPQNEYMHRISKFDLTLNALEGKKHIYFNLEYCTRLFKEETIQRFINYFKNIVSSIVKNPGQRISEIEILSKHEKHQVLYDFNDTAREYPDEKTIHQLFTEQAEKTPEKIAVGMVEKNHLTYLQLNQKSNQLAHLLQTKGLKPDTLVGIMTEPALEMAVGLLAILKAGGAYLPVNPAYPAKRKKYLLEDCHVKLLLSNCQDAYHYSREVVNLEDNHIYNSNSNVNIECESHYDHLAYVIYTSGSTGTPKGVAVEHRNVVRLVMNTNYIQWEETDRILQTGALEFDASTFEIWGALLNGLELYLAQKDTVLTPEKFKIALHDYEISTIWMTSPLFNQVVRADVDVFRGLKNLLVGGDVLSPPHINQVRTRFPRLNIINGYGPTENTTFSTTFLLDKEYEENIPIGRPIANSTTYVVDRNFKVQAPGITGELCVGGDGVARGYLNSPELTKEKFIDNPYKEGDKLYCTGDLCRWLADGNIEFLGRIDQQVKIRGFRIEPGEIVNQLLDHEQIKEAVILVKEITKPGAYQGEGDDKYLCAYIVSDHSANLSAPILREYLSKKLPDYLIPSYFIRMEKMPLTPNGKIDRKALPEPGIGTLALEGEYIAPRDEIEEKLAAIWCEVLGIERSLIGIDSNFFELGGHSLKATNLLARLHKELNVKLPLVEVFVAPTIRSLSDRIRGLKQEKFVSLEPVEKKDYYSLSPAQKRLYILQQLELNSTSYNMPYVLPWEGPIDIEKLKKTFKKLVARHESLRTSYILIGEVPVQRILADVEVEIIYDQLSKSTSPGVEKIIAGFIKPFDLAKAPLLRVGLITNHEQEHILLLDMHHIITDGTSQGLLAGEFEVLYSKEGEKLSELRLQYKDYAQWQNQPEQQTLIAHQESFWVRLFSGELPVLNLPTDYPRPLMQSFEGGTVNFLLNEKETQTLKDIAVQSEATLYMSILSVYSILLSKLSGQEDIIVGTPIAARRHADLQPIIGMFVNTLAIRTYPTGKKAINGFVKEVKEHTLEAFENQEYPFEELVDKVSVRRDTGRNPIFDVMFNLLNQEESREQGDMPDMNRDMGETNSYEHQEGTSKFDLNLTAIEGGERLLLTFEYSTKLFHPRTIESFIRYFKKILSVLGQKANRKLKLSQIEILTKKEKQEILKSSRGVEETVNAEETIHRWFEAKAKEMSDQTAIVFAGKALTYGELNRKANQLARALREKDVHADTIVGLMVERSLEMIIGILAILKAGGAYLPIDQEYPEKRKMYMLEDSGVNLILTNKDIDSVSGYIPEDIDVMDLGDEHIYKGAADNPGVLNCGSSLLYVIYTSGSTGKPKAVMLEHRNLVNLMKFQFKYTNIDFTSVLQFTTISFDVSFQEIFSTLLYGGRLVLIPKEQRNNIPELFRTAAQNEIKTLFLPASFLKFVMNEERFVSSIPRGVKHIVTAGEQVIVTAGFRKYLIDHGVYLHNHYGPTEAHVVTSLTLAPGDQIPELPPIGKPVANTGIYILDKSGHLLPGGVTGELFIGGIQVGRGYLGRVELTAAAFISSSFSAAQRWYRTGDLGRWLWDGNIEFLGRIDHQVKIRGFRIELGEIENQLLKQVAIKEAVVLDRTEESGNKYLCAYIVAAKKPSVSELRNNLARSLPDYMIPSYFVFLDGIPLTPNRKVDRRALPAPEVKPEHGHILPQNWLEEKLAELWGEVLRIKKDVISVEANFFELGGHSLNATILTAKLHKELNVNVPLGEIFKRPSIRGLSGYISGLRKATFASIKPVEKREYYGLSSAQKRLYVIQQKNPGSTAYNMPDVIPLEDVPEVVKLEKSFKKLIKHHESLKTSFHMVKEESQQRTHDHVGFEIEFYEADEGEDPVRLSFMENFIRTFDLSQAPLLRIGLIKTGKRNHFLAIDMHHIISDGFSLEILVHDFMTLYNGEELSPLRIQYKDFSQWQNHEKGKQNIRQQEAYWLKQFEDEIPALNLPTDYSRTMTRASKGNAIGFEIGTKETQMLREMMLTDGTTMFMGLLALFNVMLSKLCGVEDIVLGTPAAGRRHTDLMQVMGMFVNTLALRNYPLGEKTFMEFLLDLKKRTLEAFENQDYQFEDLVEKVEIKHKPGHNPLFDVMFVLETRGNLPHAHTDTDVEKNGTGTANREQMQYVFERGITKFDLLFAASDLGQKLFFTIEYSTELFKKETVERFASYFKEILSSVLTRSNIKLKEIKVSHDLFVEPLKNPQVDFDF